MNQVLLRKLQYTNYLQELNCCPAGGGLVEPCCPPPPNPPKDDPPPAAPKTDPPEVGATEPKAVVEDWLVMDPKVEAPPPLD